jgi:outer membrane protein, heavy metal efflux system
LPWLRSARIASAAAARDAGRYAFAFERAAIKVDIDTTYTRALAAAARARLSRRTATDADSLLAMARLRHEVGDVSELDLRLAEVNAGQLENLAVDDSLAALDALLAVQFAMGLPADQPTITLVDSLTPPPPVDSVAASTGEPLPVAAAAASLRSADRALTLAHRSVFASPSLQVGVERGDPTGTNGPLPTIGLSLPLPLFNWNGGEVALARAARDRAQATLDLVRRQTESEISRARRDLLQALTRVARDRRLLASADRVATMALQAYAEGAFALPSVLEAQRNAREALGRYIDDLAAANDAAAAVRLFSVAEEP